jgi:hypothetical protein
MEPHHDARHRPVGDAIAAVAIDIHVDEGREVELGGCRAPFGARRVVARRIGIAARLAALPAPAQRNRDEGDGAGKDEGRDEDDEEAVSHGGDVKAGDMRSRWA